MESRLASTLLAIELPMDGGREQPAETRYSGTPILFMFQLSICPSLR
jgi:hypothetical protein